MLKYSLAKAHSILFFLIKKKGKSQMFSQTNRLSTLVRQAATDIGVYHVSVKKNLLKQSIV